MGAWIEISQLYLILLTTIASHPTMGAWIEIANAVGAIVERLLSRTPRWVRGLKSTTAPSAPVAKTSHPTMGAWIEIS